jgi:hypothetical protein
MPALYRNAGVDFDDLFDPDVVGDGPTAPGYRNGSQPLRYAAVAYGSRRANVGYRLANGTDVAALWAAKGTAVYSLGFNGKTYRRENVALTGQTGNITAAIGIAFTADGNWDINGVGTGGSDSGRWLPTGQSASDYEVQVAFTLVGGVTPSAITNTAVNYVNMSNAVAASFSNTVNAALVVSRNSQMTMTVRMRRVSTGVVTTSTCDLTAYVQGQG